MLQKLTTQIDTFSQTLLLLTVVNKTILTRYTINFSDRSQDSILCSVYMLYNINRSIMIAIYYRWYTHRQVTLLSLITTGAPISEAVISNNLVILYCMNLELTTSSK